jgi:hypothetical protein
MSQQLSDRLDAVEKIIAGKHEDDKGYLAELQLKYGTPEEKAAQAAKAAEEAKKR